MTPASLDGLRADGYVPALVQQSGEDDLQAVLKAPRGSDAEDAQGLADAVSLKFNKRWGGQASDDASQALPMAGFIRQAAAKKSAITVILHALGEFCMKTLAHLKSLRVASEHQARKVALTHKSELKKGQAAAKLVHEIDLQAYRRHAALSSGVTQDQVDLDVAKKMLKEGYKLDRVTAAVRTSPDLKVRHIDADMHIKDVVSKARKALKASTP